MRYSSVKKLALFIVLMKLLSGACGWAADEKNYLYTWKDEQGVVHVTDRLDKVPNKYRSGAKQMEQGAAGGVAEGKSLQEQAPAPEAVTPRPAEDAEQLKAQWQRRMRDAQRRLADAEERYRQLEQNKKDQTAQWGSSGAALPPQEALDQMAQVDRDIEKAKSDIDDARNIIDVVIPDEARRAGIPPGWLREVQ